MVLASITARSMQEDNVLAAFTGLLIEDLASSPQRRLDVCIAADDGVLIELWFLVCRGWSSMGVMQQLENAAPDVRPMGERILQSPVSKYFMPSSEGDETYLVALYLDALLLDIHAEHLFHIPVSERLLPDTNRLSSYAPVTCQRAPPSTDRQANQ